MTEVTVVHDDHVHVLNITDEWLLSRRGWELAGGLIGDACAETSLSGLRDADDEDAVPAVPKKERGGTKPKTA